MMRLTATTSNARALARNLFFFEIDQAIAKAAASPELYPIVFGDVRRTVARRFPFSVYFRVRRDSMVVLAVFHGRRNPAVWQRRV
jgi:plasmid stabilization system protein ParE